MDSAEEPPISEDPALLSERYEAFRSALEVFYILGNISGRVRFIQDWPEAASYILGAELVGYDCDGTDDRDRRAALEELAEQKRFQLLEIVRTLEEKSVVKGVLQAEYVDGLVKEMGRDLALLIYAPRFVDRVFPPPPPPEEAAEPDSTA